MKLRNITYFTLISLLCACTGVEVENSAKKTEKPLTNWRLYEEKDVMTDKTTSHWSVKSDNMHDFEFPYNGGSRATIFIRKTGKKEELIFVISKGQLLSGKKITIRVDENKAHTLYYNMPEDYSTEKVFIKYPAKVLEEIRSSKKVFVQIPVYNEGSPTWEFSTHNFELAE